MYHPPEMGTRVDRRIQHWSHRPRRLRRNLELVAVLAALVAVTSGAEGEASGQCVQAPVAREGHQRSLDRSPQQRLTVISLNMAGEEHLPEVLKVWRETNALERADILLLQEVRQSSDNRQGIAVGLSRHLGLDVAYAAADRLPNGSTQGLAILSRYPLKDVRVLYLKHFRLRFRSRCRVALIATVDTPSGSVRAVNVHLDTRINTRDRLAQLSPVLEDIDRFEGAQLVGGDFNTMNIRWVRTMWPLPNLEQQSAAVTEAFATRGFHTPLIASSPTLRFLGLPFRLDWLYVRNLTPVASGVDPIRFSDHDAVWAQLDLKSGGAPVR